MNATTIDLKKNIMWLASYPKSGNTWFRMFLANYLKNDEEPVSLDEIESTPIASSPVDFEETMGFNPFEMGLDEVDLYRPDMYKIITQDTEDENEVFYKKIHDAYTLNTNNIPIFPAEVSIGAVYFVRNPLDVCVSYANHSSSNIKRKVKLILNEKGDVAGRKTGQLRQIMLSWKSHYDSWKSQTEIPVHIVRYEDMKQTPMETFGAIIKFLKLDYDKERLGRAIVNSDFKLLQQMEAETGFKEKAQFCENFFWKGTIGNYKEHLSEKQIERIVTYSKETMIELGYIDSKGKLTV
ncbi:MAG: sulfotransferase [Lutibacter sp.]|nr:MAG: sulfotransferase [Lutibacter sp.]